MSKKDKLLDNLEHHIYARLRPSKLQGVGVFAIKDIPKGVNPFKMTNNSRYKTIKYEKEELKHLNPEVKKMIIDFIEPDEGKIFHIPENGLNSLDITFYLNHSNDNNLGVVDDKDDEYCSFVALRTIKKGEELLINYDDYKD